MMSPLTQSPQWFFTALMIAPTIGLVSYALLRWGCERSPDCCLLICAFVALVFGSILLFSDLTEDKVKFVGTAFFLWAGATFIERFVQPSQESWIETFVKLAASTVCSAFTSLVFLVCVNGSIASHSLAASDEVWFFNGYLTGAFIAPCAIPVFLWIWKAINLRPGIDRHLKKGEPRR